MCQWVTISPFVLVLDNTYSLSFQAVPSYVFLCGVQVSKHQLLFGTSDGVFNVQLYPTDEFAIHNSGPETEVFLKVLSLQGQSFHVEISQTQFKVGGYCLCCVVLCCVVLCCVVLCCVVLCCVVGSRLLLISVSTQLFFTQGETVKVPVTLRPWVTGDIRFVLMISSKRDSSACTSA